MKTVLTVDRFFDGATTLRRTFEDRFADPRNVRGDRFVWDYWVVPDQYRLLRTPADSYFPAKIFRPLIDRLVEWGRQTLGCHSISPPWLSCYVDGCRQNLHSDVPHGPWAYVYSLSPRRPRYRGGETIILRDETLRFWDSFSQGEDREADSYVQRVPSPFNRLTVFDPRFPHGVSEVRGVEDPSEGRLVIHGWFVEPRPYVEGALTAAQTQRVIDPAVSRLAQALERLGALHGTLSFRLAVNPSGTQTGFEVLTNTIIGLDDHMRQRRLLLSELKRNFSELIFPSRPGPSRITIPLLFKT